MKAAQSTKFSDDHHDQTFPHVLVNGTAGAIIGLASVWLTALSLT